MSEGRMIQCRMRELIALKGRRERRKITYEDIQTESGVNKNSIAKLANDRSAMVGISVIDRLCAFFDCQPGDIFVYVPDPEAEGHGGR